MRISRSIYQRPPADFAFPPKLAQSIVLQPLIQIVLRKALELSAVVEVAFADQHRFRTVGECVNQSFGVGRDDQLGPLGGFNKYLGYESESVGMQSQLRLFDAHERRRLWMEQHRQQAKELQGSVGHPNSRKHVR